MATCPKCGARIKRRKTGIKYWCRRHGFVRSEDLQDLIEHTQVEVIHDAWSIPMSLGAVIHDKQ